MLHVDGVAYRMLAGWAGIVYAGLLWLAGSLFVITAPAATLALFSAIRRVASGEASPSVRAYVGEMRSNFWPATRLGLIVAVGWAMVALVILGPLPTGVLGLIVPFVVLPIFVMWALTTVWVFAIFDQRRAGVRDAFKVSYLRAVRRPMHALSALAIASLILALPILVPIAAAIPFWLSAIGGSALAVSVFTNMAASA